MTDEELRYRVDTALAEVGWGGHIRPPSRYAPKGTRSSILHRAECPRYPVGALLAGAITGCPDAKP
jgi:hypothetical protein